jgi:hypothetical protein
MNRRGSIFVGAGVTGSLTLPIGPKPVTGLDQQIRLCLQRTEPSYSFAALNAPISVILCQVTGNTYTTTRRPSFGEFFLGELHALLAKLFFLEHAGLAPIAGGRDDTGVLIVRMAVMPTEGLRITGILTFWPS